MLKKIENFYNILNKLIYINNRIEKKIVKRKKEKKKKSKNKNKNKNN